MGRNHIREIAGVYTITELMPYKSSDRHALYKGICNECGAERIARYIDLKRTKKCTHIGIDGKIISCKANWSNRRIRDIFRGMKQRCYTKSNKAYRWYGAKGIKICDDWINNPILFEEWALNNGYEDDLTIDRIDSKKDYSPENCRWVTKAQNSQHISTTSLITVDGEVHSGKEWARILELGTNRINIYVKKYGLENVVEFIRRYKASPNLIENNVNKNVYNLYMS